MKTVKFIPKLCTKWTDDSGLVHEPKFKGCVTLKIPNFFERQELKNILMDAVLKDGETDIEAIKSDHKNVNVKELLKKMAVLVEKSVPFYQAVEIESVETGVFYKSFDDMSCDRDCEAIIQEVAQELANGFTLSKNS